jgi:predicted transcriptional regulator
MAADGFNSFPIEFPMIDPIPSILERIEAFRALEALKFVRLFVFQYIFEQINRGKSDLEGRVRILKPG